MGILTILNEQAEKVCKELLKAKRKKRAAAAAHDTVKAAYHEGRAEELEKWLNSLEDLIEKIIDNKGGGKNERK